MLKDISVQDAGIKIGQKVWVIEVTSKFVSVPCPNCDNGEIVLKDGKKYACPACDGNAYLALKAQRNVFSTKIYTGIVVLAQLFGREKYFIEYGVEIDKLGSCFRRAFGKSMFDFKINPIRDEFCICTTEQEAIDFKKVLDEKFDLKEDA